MRAPALSDELLEDDWRAAKLEDSSALSPLQADWRTSMQILTYDQFYPIA